MSKKILLIDDDRTVTKLVGYFLEGEGYSVKIAHDGQDGLSMLRDDHDFDLIILDVQMPNMNGYTFVFELKRLDLPKDIPIFVLTAKEGMADIFKVEGIKEYLVKPCNQDILLQKVRQHLS